MILAIIRFRRTAGSIYSTDVRPDIGGRADAILAGLLFMLGATLLFYLAYAVITRS